MSFYLVPLHQVVTSITTDRPGNTNTSVSPAVHEKQETLSSILFSLFAILLAMFVCGKTRNVKSLQAVELPCA